MRRRLGIILTILLALGVLIAINSLAYVSEEEKQDSELAPNRSSYNSGSTGTRALYDLLNESGYPVMRFREPTESLRGANGEKVKTFLVVGDTRVPFEDSEAESLLSWVKRGGRLVIIDRHPEAVLLPDAGDWTVTTEFIQYPGFDADPGDPKNMTENVKSIRPVQPTVLTRNVESVMPSRFFSAIKFLPSTPEATRKRTQPSDANDEAQSSESAAPAPVVHLASADRNILLDYAHGRGRIVVLSDPFIVANGGISLNDNLQLAINLLAPAAGMIAFDEFHQGRGLTRNAFVGYFAGTPVLAIAGQIVLLILLVVWTRGRRFARPLPLPHVDRRSSLEFVASMAELQQRARAYDLAIENIYTRTRRVLARYAGMDYNSPRSQIAARVAARSSIDAHQLETLMKHAEEAINGGAISERQSVHLIRRLREIEGSLGIRMRARDIKQTAQNI